ncbi:MAG: cell division protein FtsA [Kiritimatiellae bacterium]|nr:cell division protein FtsA [Kiritimatiellia bacterium]
MKLDPVVALEIGTSRTVVCVGEPDENGRIRSIGIGTYPTTGVRKGQIFDFVQVSNGVESARLEAEKKSELDIFETLIASTGGHIEGVPYHEVLPIESMDKVVSKNEIDELDDLLCMPPMDTERVLLHTLYQSYSVDDQPGVANPEGMHCKMLSRSVINIQAQKSRIDNLKRVVNDLKMDVTDVVFDGFAAARAVLTEVQKRDGVLLIDLGAGTTTAMTFYGKITTDVFCLAVGGDHVTNDIASGFTIPFNRAEEVKRKYGNALVNIEEAKGRIELPAEIGFETRTINAKSLQVIINARMDELFKIIRARLDDHGGLSQLGAGVVLTGGGAYLRGVTQLASKIFGTPCRIGVPINVDGFEDVDQPASYATIAGLIKYGFDVNNLPSSKSGFGSLLKSLFGR